MAKKRKPEIKIIDGHSVAVIESHNCFGCNLESSISMASYTFRNMDCRDVSKALVYSYFKKKLVCLIGCYKFRKIKGQYHYDTVVIKHNKENEGEFHYVDEDAYLSSQGRTWYEND
jgi:hypothetical protein